MRRPRKPAAGNIAANHFREMDDVEHIHFQSPEIEVKNRQRLKLPSVQNRHDCNEVLGRRKLWVKHQARETLKCPMIVVVAGNIPDDERRLLIFKTRKLIASCN